jgi:hypothetical protein
MVGAGVESVNAKVSTETGERLTHTTSILPGLLPTQGRMFMSSVDTELMSSVEEEQLREKPELASEAELLRLVGQCSILVVIGGIVAGLIAA